MSNILNVHKPVRAVGVHHSSPFPSIEEIVVPEEMQERVSQNSIPEPSEVPLEEPTHASETLTNDSPLDTVPQVAIEALCAEARHEGYEAGIREGRAQRETEIFHCIEKIRTEELLPAITNFANLTTAIHQQWKSFGKKLDEAVITLAVAVAQQILKTELTKNSTAILNQAKEALRHISGVERLRIRVHPDDEKLLKQYRGELLAASDAVREIIFEADDHISRGGCIIESESGNVDATIETQLKKLTDVLTEDHELTA